MLNVLQVLKIMFNAVKHLNFICTFKWINGKKNKKIQGGCVIATETEMLGAPPLTKLYSGIQHYTYIQKS